MNNSPSKDSLQGSFQGYITSNFQQNLRDSKQREQDQNELILQSQNHSDREEIKDDSSDNPYYKFEGQKIKDFEKSTLIKFEEFEGDNTSQLESDPNRKHSERISDRIYERIDPQQQYNNKDDDPFATYFEASSQDDQFQRKESQQSPFYNDKKQFLYVITEEDVSEEVQSSYYAYTRVHSGGAENTRPERLSTQEFLKNGQQESYSREQQMHPKSRSQPITQAINRNSTVEKKMERFNTELTPTKKSPLQHHNSLLLPNQSQIQATRFSDSPFPQNDQDQVSQYFQRIHSHQGLRQSNINPNEFLMSEEDLLSNVDRISKILPTSGMDEGSEEIEEINEVKGRIKEMMQMIEHYKCELQNKTTLIMIKDSQINLLQMKNEEQEEEILKLKNSQPQKRDAETQVNEFERKKIREKRKFSTQMKKTPSRIGEISQDNSDIVNYNNKRSSNTFETPQLKNDNSFKESPSTSKKNMNMIMKREQSQSFTSIEDINIFKQNLQQLKQQLQKSEERNLMYQQKVDKYKHDKFDLKEKLVTANIEKSQVLKQYDKQEEEIQIYKQKLEGLKAENLDQRRQIDLLQMKLDNMNKVKSDQYTSTQDLNPALVDQLVQTEFLITKKSDKINTRNTSNKKRDVFIFDDFNKNADIESSISSKSLNNNITIINNNKNDLNILLERAKDYEQISQKLQSEINQHRKLLKDNQIKMQQDIAQQNYYKKKIKKREQKIESYRVKFKELENQNVQLKIKLEEQSKRFKDTKMKMEAKLQDRDFKILTMKNQIKHQFSIMNSGLLTPTTPNMASRMYSQNELYNLINQIVQQSFQNQKFEQNLMLNKPRAKSYDQPSQYQATSFYDENFIIDDPKIMTPNHAMMVENPSFANNEIFGANGIGNSRSQQQQQQQFNTPTVQGVNRSLRNAQQNNINVSNSKDSLHLQNIFSSSMRRIHDELESIKDFNSSQKVPQFTNLLKQDKHIRNTNNNSWILSNNKHIKDHPDSFNEVIIEDSIQSDGDSITNNQQLQRIVYNQRTSSIPNVRLNSQEHQKQQRNNSHQNTQTFRSLKQQYLAQSPNKRPHQQIQINEQQLFNNTQSFNEKEQNASFFYDMKPQFENSNFTNTSIIALNQTQTNLQNQRNQDSQQISFKNADQKQSFNSSIRNPPQIHQQQQQQQHIRLNSNLKRDSDMPESSDDIEVYKESYRRKFKSITETVARNTQNKYQTNMKNEEIKNKHAPLRTKNNSSQNVQKFGTRFQQERLSIEQNSNRNPIKSPQLVDGSRSTLSNYSQKLDDLKKKYGRIN